MSAVSSALTFSPLVHWLAWLARRHEQAARRFDEIAQAIDDPAPPPGELRVCSGLHAGAVLALIEDDYLLGSGLHCDIVLLDADVPARCVHLLRRGDGYKLVSAFEGGAIVPSIGVAEVDGHIETSYELQGVRLLVSHVAPAPDNMATQQESIATRLMRPGVMAGVAVAAAALAGAGVWASQRNAETPTQRVSRATVALAGVLPPWIHLKPRADGGLVAEGLVADAGERAALFDRLAAKGWGDVQWHVGSASELARDLRESLGDADLQIRYDGHGHIRVEGTTDQFSVQKRLADIARDRGGDDIDDRVVLVDAQHRKEPATFQLPWRITDVSLGESPYFRTEAGGRYYLGSALPDGSQVVAIEANEIVFSRNDKKIVFRLD